MNMLAIFSNVWATLGILGVTVVTLTSAAYALFRYLGQKWLTAKFDERLETYKHEQQRQLEQLRFKISALLDRTVKLHQQEFDVLPELWARLNEAFGHVLDLTARYKQYPDINSMNSLQLEDFLSDSGLKEYQKAEIRAASDKMERYAYARFWQVFYEVEDKYREFNRYFVTKGIFLQPELRIAITELRNLMYEAIDEREREQRDPEPRPGRFEKGDLIRAEGKAKLEAIGEAVRARLWHLPSLDARDVEPQ
jgi:hypothetical protein